VLVEIFVRVEDFNCFKEFVPDNSAASDTLARTARFYGNLFPSTGEVVIICGEPEARDLLTHATNHCQDSLVIRAAIRRANFSA